MSNVDLRNIIKPGDTILVGQATAEPPLLVEQLLDLAADVENLTAIAGYAQTSAWKRAASGHLRVKSYAAHGPLRGLSRRGLLEILPLHYSEIEKAIVAGRLPIDVVLLQVGPADEDGFYDLGPTVDFTVAAAKYARAVIVEVNDTMPRTNSAHRLHVSKVTATVRNSASLIGSPIRPPSDVERKVAANVAGLVPSGATIQLGVGALADAIAYELRDHRHLHVRSGLVGDWLVGLWEAGALTTEPECCVAGMALGSERLYSFLNDNELVRMAPLSELISPEALGNGRPYISINSGLEVDLLGQIGSEVVEGTYIGAVGSQVDFFRAARSSEGGRAIAALPSVSSTGQSRILGELHGPVTTLKSDVDIVVTDWGVAEISTATLSERAELIVSLAAPEFRDELRRSRPRWSGGTIENRLGASRSSPLLPS